MKDIRNETNEIDEFVEKAGNSHILSHWRPLWLLTDWQRQ